MKVLWLCNIVLPDIAKELNLSTSVGGGWLKQTSQQLASCDNIEFAVCSPAPKHKGFSTGKTKNLKFLLFRTSDKNIVSVFREFLEDFKPDIIHIFGTEYPHSFHMVKAAEQLNILHKVVISIQGMVSVCASHFLAYMNHKETLHYTLRDFIKHNNIYNQRLEFKRRGKYEIEALKLSKNVIGRTDWDEACATLALNCKTVPEYPYKISLFVPEGFKTEQLPMEYRPDLQGYVCVLTVPGSENGSYHAEIVFTKE